MRMTWPKKWKPGTYVGIQLSDGTWAGGRTLFPFNMLFYDWFGGECPSADSLRAAPVAFVVGVTASVSRASGWTPVGWDEPTPDLQAPIRRSHQDIISKRYSIRTSRADGSWAEDPASWEEVQGLEPSAGWAAVHVLERLEALRDGREAVGVKALALKPPR